MAYVLDADLSQGHDATIGNVFLDRVMGLQHLLPQSPETDRRSNRRLAYSVTQAAEQLSISRSTMYQLAKADKVRLSKIGARSVVFDSDLQEAAANFREA